MKVKFTFKLLSAVSRGYSLHSSWFQFAVLLPIFSAAVLDLHNRQGKIYSQT